jgi:RNA polymerase sigma-70 factor (ECF subfamily)
MNNGMQQGSYVAEEGYLLRVPTQIELTDSVASGDDLHLIKLLRNGNEAAFVSLVDHYSGTMVRLAMMYVTAWPVAEEVVQETWMSVIENLDRFEGRSSLKTWIFRILTNCAKTRAQRERRCISFSSLSDRRADHAEPASEPDHLLLADHHPIGHWVSGKREEMPEEHLLSQEIRMRLEQAIEALPSNQREIVILRDVEGWSADEIYRNRGISKGNQRVLLHRARLKMRSALEKFFREE